MTTTLESFVAQMTVAELAEKSGRSISDLVELVLARNGHARPAARPATNGARKRDPKPAAVSAAPATPTAAAAVSARKKAVAQTRTQAGRSTYDATVLAAVKSSKGKVKAEELRTKVGGTPPQLRAALARLIDNGAVKSSGKARGTAYTAV